MQSLIRIRAQLNTCWVDDDLLERSRMARAGYRVIQMAALLRAVEPALLLVATTILMAVPALAQTPGGDIFGGNDQVLGNGVREAIRWGRNLLFLLGVAGVAWGTINYMTEKAYIKQFIAAFLFDLKLRGAPLEMWTGLSAAALAVAFFNWARIGRRPHWLQHKIRALIESPCQRRTLPRDELKGPPRRWIIDR